MRITVTEQGGDDVSGHDLGGALRKVVDRLGKDPGEVVKGILGKDAKGIHVVTPAKNDGFLDFAVSQYFDSLAEDHAAMLKRAKARVAKELERASTDPE